MRDSFRLMNLCNEQLPDQTEEYIPDLVHDFIWDNWKELKEILDGD